MDHIGPRDVVHQRAHHQSGLTGAPVTVVGFPPRSLGWGRDSASTSPSPGMSGRSGYISTPLGAPRGRMGGPDSTPYPHGHPPLVVHLGGKRDHLGILRRDCLVVSHAYERWYWSEGLTVRVLQ